MVSIVQDGRYLLLNDEVTVIRVIRFTLAGLSEGRRLVASRKRTFRVSNTQTLKPLLLPNDTGGAGARILIVGLC